MAEAEAIGKGRRLYMSKADIMKHGLTEGCLGCRCLAEGKRAQGHSEGCLHDSKLKSPRQKKGEHA